MTKRVPELSSIIDSIILTNDIELPREFPYKTETKRPYRCPACHCVFNTYKINDNRNRSYIRQSAQAMRHYKRLTCINRFKLVNKGYIRNDMLEKRASKYQAYRNKPTLSNATQYLLGLGKYRPVGLQLLTYGLLKRKLLLKPNKTSYEVITKRNIRVYMNHLVSDENTRAVSIPEVSIDVIGKVIKIDTMVPAFKSRRDIEVFVNDRLKLMATYFRPLEKMIYMPSIWNSETLRPKQKELTDDMRDYLNVLDPSIIPIIDQEYVGLLSQ
tara:strand:+ start:4303 stop:5112 length:810 start_codon:yes stop_codon:yes gene_type:complete